MHENKLQHFYIAEEQSVYLLSNKDATKLKTWVDLCQQQLSLLGYNNIALLGKGAYGFVFNGEDGQGQNLVFKFSRINLPQHVQDRLADEADIQAELNHERIPKVIDFYKIKRQSILNMSRAPGIDLEKHSFQNGLCPFRPKTRSASPIHSSKDSNLLRISPSFKCTCIGNSSFLASISIPVWSKTY